MPELILAPIEDAMLYHDAKTPIGSVLRSAGWAQTPVQFRITGQFSAGVESAKMLQRVQDGVSDILSHRRNANGALTSRSGFIADLQKLAISEGLTPVDESKRGTIQDITSEARARLIYEMQTADAMGFANWKSGQDPDMLNAVPAWELYRKAERKVKRHWEARWQEAGAAVGWVGASKEAMVALKTSPIWEALSRFGKPWPPFDFGSGMWVRPVLRRRARELGLLQMGQELKPSKAEFTDKLQREVKELKPAARQNLKSIFGDQIEVDQDVVKWKGDAKVYEQQRTRIREDAGRVFARSEEALGGNRLGGGSPDSPSQLQADVARANAVEISAVSTGRKPLFHESYGDANWAESVAKDLQPHLPNGVVARSEGPNLFVYDQGLTSKFATEERPVWDQVRDNSDNGRWLGFGLDRFEAMAAKRATVQVVIVDPAGKAVAGFQTDIKTAELYAAARALDWTRATGQNYEGRVIRYLRGPA